MSSSKMLSDYYSSYAICTECSESICNPICPKCLAREIKKWLENGNYLRNEIKKKFLQILKKLLSKNLPLEGTSSPCIICKQGNAYMCPYCFTEKIYDLLQKEKVSRNAIKKFLKIFNFDFERTGYAREMKLG